MMHPTHGLMRQLGIQVQAESVLKKTLPMPTTIGFQHRIPHLDRPIQAVAVEQGVQPTFKVMSSSMRSWQMHGQVSTTAVGLVVNGLKFTTTERPRSTSLAIGCKTLPAT